MSKKHLLVNGRPVVHAACNGYAKAISINYTGDAKIPLPYTVLAESSNLANTCNGLLVNNNPCATIESYIKTCIGDEAGDGGGIFSGTIGQRCDFITGSPDTIIGNHGVLTINGNPVLREGDLCLLNNRNSAVAPIQIIDDDRIEDQSNDIIARATDNLSTPFIIDVSVLDTKSALCLEQLAIFDNQLNTCLQKYMISMSSNDTKSIWRHLRCINLPNTSLALGIYVPTSSGEKIFIKFPAPTQVPYLEDIDKPPDEHQDNCLIPIRITTHLTPIDGKLNSSSVDLSDLLRLPFDLRKTIYNNIIQKNLTADEWYSTLNHSYRYEIDSILKSKSQGAFLRPGFIYIYINKNIWRELQVDDHGMFCEIDLHNNWEMDIRQSAGIPSEVIYLPLKIAGCEFEIEIGFSEVQWSWERIKYLNMNDEMRNERLIRVNLSIYAKKNCLPIIYLPDALHPINNAIDDIIHLSKELTTADLKLSKTHPSNSYENFHPDYLNEYAKNKYPQYIWSDLSPSDQLKQLKEIETTAYESNITALIIKLQNIAVSLLQASDKGLPIMEYNSSLLYDIYPQLLDYFSLSKYRYEKAFDLLANITKTMLIVPNTSSNPKLSPAGYRYIDTLFDEKHPLHHSIFASSQQVNDINNFDIKFNQQPATYGDGKFNSILFAHDIYRIENPCFEKMAHHCNDTIKKSYNYFANSLLEINKDKATNLNLQAIIKS